MTSTVAITQATTTPGPRKSPNTSRSKSQGTQDVATFTGDPNVARAWTPHTRATNPAMSFAEISCQLSSPLYFPRKNPQASVLFCFVDKLAGQCHDSEDDRSGSCSHVAYNYHCHCGFELLLGNVACLAYVSPQLPWLQVCDRYNFAQSLALD